MQQYVKAAEEGLLCAVGVAMKPLPWKLFLSEAKPSLQQEEVPT
jgi:hypothetical protein